MIIHIPFEKALQTLRDAMVSPPKNDLERDGIIKRFEYCVELSWKTAKKKLEQNAIESDSPRDIFRIIAKMGWIDDASIWFEFLEARNKTSHMYRQDVANAIFAVVPRFLPEAEKLLKKISEMV